MTVPSVQPVHPSNPSQLGLRPRRKVEHWTPKGDCSATGIKEISFNFMKEIPLQKVDKKIDIAFKFKWKILYKLIGPQKKITRKFPLNLIWFHFTGKSFVFFSTFSMISKKSNLEGVFDFFYSDPQLNPNFKPTRNLSGQL